MEAGQDRAEQAALMADKLIILLVAAVAPEALD
jgi:hypothetical protein